MHAKILRKKGANEKGKKMKLLRQSEFHSANVFVVLNPRIVHDLLLCLCRVRGETHPNLTCGSIPRLASFWRDVLT